MPKYIKNVVCVLTNHLFWIFLGVYISTHLLTLTRAPLPWFDEVFFASLAQNLVQKGTFHVPVTVVEYEIKLYGFVYFVLTGWAQSVVNYNIYSVFAFRLVNFLAGMGVVVVLCRQARLPLGAMAVFLLDPFLHLCLHEGRMDLMATLFILLVLFYVQKNELNAQVLAGIFGLLALLTTARVAFMGLGVAVFWAGQGRQAKMFASLRFWVAPMIVLVGYSLWIFLFFGGISSFLKTYTEATNAHSHISAWTWYVGGTGYIPKHQYALLMCLGVAFVAYLFVVRGDTNHENNISKGLVSTYWVWIFSFHLLVHDLGQYSIFILPAYYGLLGHYIGKVRFGWVLWVLLGLFNASYFTMKTAQTVLTWDIRNPQIAQDFVQKHIPHGSKVVGEAMYYYAVRASGSDYQMFEVYNDLPVRERIQRAWGYQYIIVTKHSSWRHKETVDYYLRQRKVRKIASLACTPSPTALWVGKIARLSPTENAGYSADIYKVEE